jgi:amino acid transporter
MKDLISTSSTGDALFDEEKLQQLGYKQEFHRELSSVSNYGTALSIICITIGVGGLLTEGLARGGPVVMVWGWLVVSILSMTIGLSMAEICSSLPTSGAMYHWSGLISPHKYAPFISWMTGWYNLLGQITVLCGVCFTCALFILSSVSIGLTTTTMTMEAGEETRWNYSPEPGHVVAVTVAVIISCLALQYSTRFAHYMFGFGCFINIFAPMFTVVMCLSMAPSLQSPTFVFTQWNNASGIESDAWVVLAGLLMSGWCFTGYDSCVHVSEETRKAGKFLYCTQGRCLLHIYSKMKRISHSYLLMIDDTPYCAEVAGPVGIVMAIAVSAIFGLMFIIGLLFSIQDVERSITSPTGLALTQIIYDCTGKKWTLVIMTFNILAAWVCSYSVLVAGSRMAFAFSRDGGLGKSLSPFFTHIHPYYKVPIRAGRGIGLLAAILVLLYLGNSTAYSAITSLATIALYISYGIPIVLKLVSGETFILVFHLSLHLHQKKLSTCTSFKY